VILSDFDLRSYIRSKRLKIEPFDEAIIRENGLDLRIDREYCRIVGSDKPFTIGEDVDVGRYYSCDVVDDYIELEPSTRYLLTTVEFIEVPPELMAFVELRSTFARLGMLIPPTIIDGGFKGQITVELLAPPFKARVPVGTRFLHVVFAKLTTPVTKPYSGRYQYQRGVRLPELRGL